MVLDSHLTFRDNRVQGDHFSEKPGNVREFDSCQGIDHMSWKSGGKSGKTVHGF